MLLLLYMFHRVSRDISRALNPPSLGGVDDGGDALPCLWIIGGGVPAPALLNSLFSNFTYSTMRASNSDGAIPGIGPAANNHRDFPLIAPKQKPRGDADVSSGPLIKRRSTSIAGLKADVATRPRPNGNRGVLN